MIVWYINVLMNSQLQEAKSSVQILYYYYHHHHDMEYSFICIVNMLCDG
jgi:hypothetical protein